MTMWLALQGLAMAGPLEYMLNAPALDVLLLRGIGQTNVGYGSLRGVVVHRVTAPSDLRLARDMNTRLLWRE